jgi:hypothetical protein
MTAFMDVASHVIEPFDLELASDIQELQKLPTKSWIDLDCPEYLVDLHRALP